MAYQQYNPGQYASSQYGCPQPYQQAPPPGYIADHYAQTQQQHQPYQPTPPQIRNPFAPPPPSRSQYAGTNSGFDPEYEAQVAQWQSAYAAQPEQQQVDRNGRKITGAATVGVQGASAAPVVGLRAGPTLPGGVENGVEQVKAKDTAAGADGEKKKTVVRQGGGQSWEDSSLLEWDPTQFRIMVGNLAGEVTDDSLAKAFATYGVSKARVVRDKRTTKSKGFGFVSFTDGEMGFRAAREMAGKYIGSHPVTIQRAKTDVKPVVQKDKKFGKGKNNKWKDKKNGDKSGGDPLKANTGAHIEKKPVRNPAGYKVLG